VGIGVLWGGVCVHLLCVVVVGFLLFLPVHRLGEVSGAAGLPAAPCRAGTCEYPAGETAGKALQTHASNAAVVGLLVG
jgi:hypothetical protein